MKRRTFLQGISATVAASGLASSFPAPALAQSERAKTLVYVPPSGLLVLDPHFTTISPTTFYGHSIYDTLYSVDSKYQAKPQMAEGHTVSDDNLTWNIRLRPGLKFHDGEPVRAQDCVASIKRWGQRDAFGSSLLSYVNEISAADDRTIRIQLNKPFGMIPDALGHPIASPCVIMPERVAAAPITQQVTETIGSGPLKFVKSEFIPGQRAVFEKNRDYVPRQEAPDGTSGGKVINFDRVEWRTIADQATAAAALQAGEVDWLDTVHLDLVELLKADSNLVVTPSDPGYRNWVRFNCGTAPFNNPALRRAVAAAIDQTVFTQALLGASTTQNCFAMYACGLPGVNELGKGLMAGPKNYAALAAKVKEAGYKGEKVVIINPTDNINIAPMGPVLQDVLTKLGMNVELQSMDYNTWASRRASNAPVDQGGWSIFPFLTLTPTTANPVVAVFARGLGASGYAGNYDDPTLEGYIAEWIGATSEADRLAKLNKVHARLWETVPIVPLANYPLTTAFRSDLTGYLSFPIALPWGIRRA